MGNYINPWRLRQPFGRSKAPITRDLSHLRIALGYHYKDSPIAFALDSEKISGYFYAT